LGWSGFGGFVFHGCLGGGLFCGVCWVGFFKQTTRNIKSTNCSPTGCYINATQKSFNQSINALCSVLSKDKSYNLLTRCCSSRIGVGRQEEQERKSSLRLETLEKAKYKVLFIKLSNNEKS